MRQTAAAPFSRDVAGHWRPRPPALTWRRAFPVWRGPGGRRRRVCAAHAAALFIFQGSHGCAQSGQIQLSCRPAVSERQQAAGPPSPSLNKRPSALHAERQSPLPPKQVNPPRPSSGRRRRPPSTGSPSVATPAQTPRRSSRYDDDCPALLDAAGASRTVASR